MTTITSRAPFLISSTGIGNFNVTNNSGDFVIDFGNVLGTTPPVTGGTYVILLTLYMYTLSPSEIGVLTVGVYNNSIHSASYSSGGGSMTVTSTTSTTVNVNTSYTSIKGIMVSKPIIMS